MPKSDFLPALDKFWNTFASARPDVVLVVCGSAASWVVSNLFKNRGGLHNRITGRIYLAPFSLGECESFFNASGIVMNRYQIAEIYMILGGIPYYLNMLQKELGPSQNIDSDLQRRKMIFLSETGTNKAVHITMITTFGLEKKGYRASIQSEVMLDDLFLTV